MIQNVRESTSSVVDLVGKAGTLIPDDVICSALKLIKKRTGSPYHGHNIS